MWQVNTLPDLPVIADDALKAVTVLTVPITVEAKGKVGGPVF